LRHDVGGGDAGAVMLRLALQFRLIRNEVTSGRRTGKRPAISPTTTTTTNDDMEKMK
jgi:hypothetical protein